jgi:hypothetical protein
MAMLVYHFVHELKPRNQEHPCHAWIRARAQIQCTVTGALVSWDALKTS